MKGVGYTGILVVILSTACGYAQESMSSAGVRIDAKLTPYRVFRLFPSSAQNIEINFYIDGEVAPSSTLKFECVYLNKGGQRTGSLSGWLPKSEFKPSGNGRLVARKLIEQVVPTDVTSTTCRVVDTKK